MKQARTTLLLLTAIFLITEVLFNFLVLRDGNGDIIGASVKTVIFLVLILLFSKRLNWAKWTLSILLIIYGLLCIPAGLESGVIFLYIGIYNMFFGIFIHKSSALGAYRNSNTDSTTPVETSGSIENNETFVADGMEHQYPRLIKRFQASFIDGLLLLIILSVVMVLLQDDETNSVVRISVAVIVLCTYEPFLTAYSTTVGQRLMKIRVGRHGKPSERINLLNAYIRWFTKGFLGLVSFFTIQFNPEHRAIHDFASDSVMISED